MPFEHLVASFNERFTLEHRLDAPPLTFDGERVRGRFGNLTFTSRLKPVRLQTRPSQLTGHDTAPLVFTPASPNDTTHLLYGQDAPNIVSLDRLSRTVHMLNYLLLDQPEGSLFLHVHPHHVLTVQKDHGAYFEEIIRRCGLPLRRVVISLTLSRVSETQHLLLLERLKRYHERGYSTAVRFDELAASEFVERFSRQFLHRFAADYVRFDAGFFRRAYQNRGGQRQRAALLSAIRYVDTQILVDSVKTRSDVELIAAIRPDYVQGPWYEGRVAPSDWLEHPADPPKTLASPSSAVTMPYLP